MRNENLVALRNEVQRRIDQGFRFDYRHACACVFHVMAWKFPHMLTMSSALSSRSTSLPVSENPDISGVMSHLIMNFNYRSLMDNFGITEQELDYITGYQLKDADAHEDDERTRSWPDEFDGRHFICMAFEDAVDRAGLTEALRRIDKVLARQDQR